MRVSRVLCLLLLIPLLGATGLLAVAPGQVRGRIFGADERPLSGAALVLANDITGYRQQVMSREDGSFLFYNVPENPYHLLATFPGFRPYHADVEVRGSLPVTRDVTLAISVAAETEARGEAEPVALDRDVVTTRTAIDRSLIRRSAAALPSGAFEAIVTSTPGFSLDDDGRHHFQGGCPQQLLVIDGQPVGDQMGITFSNSLDAAVAESLEIVTGGIPAEYGEKAYGVLNLTTRSGLGTNGVKGDVSVGGASFETQAVGAGIGGGTSRLGWFVNLDASRSDRFLDPVSFDSFHNDGSTERGFIRLDSVSEAGRDSFRLTSNVGRTRRDVTNLPSQEAAGQDQRVLSTDWNVNFGWQHIAPGGLVVDTQLYARDNRLTLYSSPYDTPVAADQNRSLENQGINLSVSKAIGINEVKIGFQAKRFPISEQFRFGITDPSFNDPASDDYNPNLAPYDLARGGSPFQFADSKTGSYVAAFVQDTVRLGDLTVNAGLRYDQNHLFQTEHQLAPRIGAAYYVDRTKTVLRASYDRMFITPEYENILLSSSAQAASLTPPDVQESNILGFGQLYNVSERQDNINVGLQQGIGSKLRLDLSYWHRRVTNAADQDQFFNTGIVFPLNFKGADLHGWNVRLDLAPIAGFRGYLSVGHIRAVYDPPFVGGLFLDSGALDTLTAGPFVIDHDQDLQEQLGIFYDLGRTGFWAGVTQRYDSGYVANAGTREDVLSSPDTAYADPYIRYSLDPQRLKSRTVWSFSIGASLRRYGLPLEFQVDLLNAFDEKGLYNFQSVCGGTHVIPPRTYAAHVKFVF